MSRTGAWNNLRRAMLLWTLALMVVAASAAPWIGRLEVRDPDVWPGGRSGNYGTAKYYVDESAGDRLMLEVSVQVYADGAGPQDLEVQAFTNLNRRDFARVFEPLSESGGPTSYFYPVAMAAAGSSGENLVYRAVLPIEKTGVYRLTARFRQAGGAWRWHNDCTYDGVAQRDCAIVVSPKKVLGLSIYEANPLVIEATAASPDGRSTFEDFGQDDNDGFNPFDLRFIRETLGFNTLWLMPIFPVTQERWDPVSRELRPNHSPGSPYAARDYWSVAPHLSADNTPNGAMQAFQRLVDEAEARGLNVFLDIAFNHAGRDVVAGQGAVDLNLVSAADSQRRIRELRPAWATHGTDYRRHADAEAAIALYAPADRLGEHGWYDAGFDWYFGDYASLGPKPERGDTRRGGALDERDLFFTDLDPAGGHDFEVENVWNYFAYLLPYWLQKTGNKLDGIRADFAQGLPPQAWEYIINKTRQRKWDFVFLGEALDPDVVCYRANRQFDVLTTLHHGRFRDTGVNTADLNATFESEANLYGYNAAIMHNGTSHDEVGNANPWLMVARYAVAAASHGVPMVFMSQPLGVAHKVNFETAWTDLRPFWDNANPGVFAMYRRINLARDNHPALRGTARYFLQRRSGGGMNQDIFAVARWSGDDQVLVFVNLRERGVAPDVFEIPAALPLDRRPGVRYQVFNLVADDPDQPLWPQPRSADEIYRDGVFVRFNLPNEVQYLQLRKV